MVNLTDSTGVMFGAHRSLQPSFLPTQPYAVNTTYEAAIQQRLGRRFDVGVNASRYALDYRSFVTPPAVEGLSSPHETVDTYSGSFGLLLRRWGRYAVYASQWERRSTDPLNNYRDLRAGVTITPARWLTASGGRVSVNIPGL